MHIFVDFAQVGSFYYSITLADSRYAFETATTYYQHSTAFLLKKDPICSTIFHLF